MMHRPVTHLFRRGSVMVFEDIELVDLDKVAGLYPSAQGRLFELLDRLDEEALRPVPAADDDIEV